MKMADAERHSLLKDEYLLLQNQYEDFDKRSLTIKGWIGSGSVAALAIALDGKQQAPMIIPVATAILALVFWYHEATWKMFQYSFADRIRVIEAYFRQDPDRLDLAPPAPLQTYNAWFKTFVHDPPVYKYELEQRLRGRSQGARFLKAALQPFVCTLYLTIIALSLVSLGVLSTQR